MPTPAEFTASLFLAERIFVAGHMANRQPAPAASSASIRQVLHYTCPMHPQYKSDHPGDAPCCGLRPVLVYAGTGGSNPDPVTSDTLGMLRVGAAKQQSIGVRTGNSGEVSRGGRDSPSPLILRCLISIEKKELEWRHDG